MADITFKRGDTPTLVRNLKETIDGTTTAIDLTTNTSVLLLLKRQQGSTTAVSRACTVTNAVGGEVTCTLQAADTATAGDYNLEYEITWNDGRIETVPSGTYVTVSIVADLGGA